MEVFVEAEEYIRKDRNAFVILLCCVCRCVCVYGSAESIVAVSFIRFLSFFFYNLSLSLPCCV